MKVNKTGSFYCNIPYSLFNKQNALNKYIKYFTNHFNVSFGKKKREVQVDHLQIY